MKRTFLARKGFKRKVGTSLKKRRKRSARQKMEDKADMLFSQFIRRKYGKKCFTCPKVGKTQCGHWISRGIKVLRWNENNARPQCFGCNIMAYGRPIEFRIHLAEEIGEEAVKELESHRKDLFKPSKTFLPDLIRALEFKLEMLNHHE